MVTVTSEEVRAGLGELINRVAYGGERVMVTRRGKPVVAFVSLEDLEFIEKVLDALEDGLADELIAQNPEFQASIERALEHKADGKTRSLAEIREKYAQG